MYQLSSSNNAQLNCRYSVLSYVAALQEVPKQGNKFIQTLLGGFSRPFSSMLSITLIQYNYLLHLIILNIISTMISLAQQLLPEASDTESIILDNLFLDESHLNDQPSLLQVFESTSLEDHLRVLKRIHLDIPHVPRLNLLGDFHKNIEINMPIYKRTLLQHIPKLTHEDKLDSVIQLLNTYQQLINEYGYFLLTHQHIRVDQHNRMGVWINQDFTRHQCSLPLKSSLPNIEGIILREFLRLIKQFFKADIFKNRNILSFGQLADYLDYIKKRNRIHKRCSKIVRELSQQKRRMTLSVRNRSRNTPKKKYERELRPISSFCALGVSKIMSGYREKQSLMNISISRIEVSKGSDESKKMKSQVDTTIFDTQFKNTRNVSYLQLSNIIQKSQKKSCVFGSSPELIKDNPIKHSSVLSRENIQSDVSYKNANRFGCTQQRKQYQPMRIQSQTEQRICFLEKKSSLQMGLNSLLLSQINEDPQNETVGSDLKKRQHLKNVVEQFESLLSN